MMQFFHKVRRILIIFLKAINLKIEYKLVCKFQLNGEYLVATKNGLYHIKNSNIYRIMVGEFYGITRLNNDKYLVFKKGYRKGSILQLQRDKDQFFKRAKKYITNLSEGIHQIDHKNNKLYITDTYNNRISIYDITFQPKLIKNIYPNHNLLKGRKSENYAHFNSIYLDGYHLIILAHNETTKTDKKSEVYVCDGTLDFRVTKKFQVNGGNCHNILIFESTIIICDSMNQRLLINDESVGGFKSFLRGLSLSEDEMLIGGSEYAERVDRNKAKGRIFKFDLFKNEILDQIEIPGMVQEIRRLDKKDYGLYYE